MQDHRYEALGKPVFEDLEPDCFTRVQSSLYNNGACALIWNRIVLHGYKAKVIDQDCWKRFGTGLFYTGTKRKISLIAMILRFGT